MQFIIDPMMFHLNPNSAAYCARTFIDGKFSQKNGSGGLKFLDFSEFIINFQKIKNVISPCFFVI